jgi:hypothetical protein
MNSGLPRPLRAQDVDPRRQFAETLIAAMLMAVRQHRAGADVDQRDLGADDSRVPKIFIWSGTEVSAFEGY